MKPYTPPEPYATLHHDDGYFTTTKREHDLRYSGPVRTKAFTEAQLRSEVERVRRETVEECAKKPNCTECAKWAKEQADNREWIAGVKSGRKIVDRMVEAVIGKNDNENQEAIASTSRKSI